MASDIGILINVGIVLVLYLCMDRIQKLVFDGDSSAEGPRPRRRRQRRAGRRCARSSGEARASLWPRGSTL